MFMGKTAIFREDLIKFEKTIDHLYMFKSMSINFDTLFMVEIVFKEAYYSSQAFQGETIILK